jgi:hypothetical protein
MNHDKTRQPDPCRPGPDLRLKAVLALLFFVLACGGGTDLSVSISTSESESLDPFQESFSLTNLRFRFRASDVGDEVVRDVTPDQRQVVFSSLPSDGEGVVTVEGFTSAGNAVAFGRQRVNLAEETDLIIPFRRNLAYVAHAANANQDHPEGQIYVIDLVSRTLSGKLRVPGVAPVARGISARGGESMLIAYEDGGKGFLGVLSQDSHAWTSVALSAPQDLALSVPGQRIAVVAGGNLLSFVDLETGRVVEECGFAVAEGGCGGGVTGLGGVVLDGAMSEDGRNAVFVVTAGSGLIFVDVERRKVSALDLLASPSGIALAEDGRLAYLTSSLVGTVVSLDLQSRQSISFDDGGFVRPVLTASYSEEAKALLAPELATQDDTRVLAFLVPEGRGVSRADSNLTLPNAREIAGDGTGKRMIVISAGTSTANAGLTILENAAGALPVGSRSLYPLDPDDTYVVGAATLRQRYSPSNVGVVYGR